MKAYESLAITKLCFVIAKNCVFLQRGVSSFFCLAYKVFDMTPFYSVKMDCLDCPL